MMKHKFPFEEILPCGVCKLSDVGGFLNCRAKSRIPQNAKSVITYLFPYYLGEKFYEGSNISKYAVSEDYHNIVSVYLEKISEKLQEQYPENVFETFCDNSPVNEVEAARLCGLGVKGRNTLLINNDYGSFIFIGEVITDKEFSEYSLPEDRTCLGCGLCEKNCPENALAKFSLNKEKCFSHISQKKGELSKEEEKLFNKRESIWGCDICQNICPMNKNIKATPIKEFYETAKANFQLGDSIENRAFSWRGEKVIERNFKIKYCKQRENNL